ncbi:MULTISPECIES: DNA-processing protein DprA [Microbacterium]|uniref:DNA-processing protein DprA n=1 Tax=Microbacterium TaxID=33882 RepID=UPI000C44DA7F|nr:MULTISPECIES: DNA-processing protein DprA [Microbacterium]MAY48366.1 DNA-protecting protein DprA [Microbacterium sp.]|tara:strand:- start:53287 stop:54471 length:1185 start_codon:yes stop_codon:yes gene_type:complete
MTDYDLTPTAIRDALGPFGEGLDDEAAVEMYARVAWSHVAEPGDADAGALIGALGPAVALDTVASSVPTPVGELDGLAARHAWARWRPRLDGDAVFRSLRAAHRIGAMLITPAASDWPESLNDLGAHAPVAVWVRGTVDAWRSTAVAIVGARAATSYGEHVAADLAAGIGAYGGAVVSGAAYGVDGAAHRAALAVGSPTVAFLAGGVDRAYPRGNSALIERIAEVGALVSELPPGAAPTKWRFLQRNRLIAALGAATVVVEAGWRSGSLNTAGHAVSLGRPLGAVPGPVTSAASAGCHRLLREYDAVAVTGADDAWELVGRLDAREVERADGAMGGPRTDAATRVVDALSTRAGRSTDEAARGAGLSVAETGSLLGLLELEGRVRRDDRGWRRA